MENIDSYFEFFEKKEQKSWKKLKKSKNKQNSGARKLFLDGIYKIYTEKDI